MSALILAAKSLRQSFPFKLYKHYIIDSILIVRQSGFKALLRQRGWKFFGIIIAYYAIRDTLVYIVVPYCVAQGLF